MAQINVRQQVVERSLSAVITRADGTVEDLGVINYWHRAPTKRLLWRVKRWLGGKR